MILTEEYINSLDRKIYNDVDTCLDHFSSLNLEKDISFWNKYIEMDSYIQRGEKPDILYYHVYWFGEFTERQALCVKSYLATQNINQTKLMIWIEPDMSINDMNKLRNRFSNLHCYHVIEFKIYEHDKLSKGTPFEGHNFINIKDDKYIKYRSDFARIMILYHYGGIYFDLDMILFKDLSPFLHMEFCYQWSNIDNRGNNALLSLHKGSDMCIYLMERYVDQIKNKLVPLNIGLNGHIFTNELSLVQLPCSLFDPCWILVDNNKKSKYSKFSQFNDFFHDKGELLSIENGDINIFSGKIFAYHWHSRTNYPIQKNSYFRQVEYLIDYKLYNINVIFDKIFVINLDHRKDRWNECKLLFKKYNINNYERFTAVSPKLNEISYDQYKNFIVNKKDWYVPGAVGCKMSHLNIIKLAKHRGYKNILILEDDFSISKDVNEFNTILFQSMKEIDNNWDMLYLGGNNLVGPNKIMSNKYIYKAVKVNTTHAYAIKSSIYDKCINEIGRCGTEIDDYYKRNIQNKCKTYCIYPSLIKQRESVSDIFKGSVMKYNFE